MAKDKIMDRKIIKQEIFYFLSAAMVLFVVMELLWPRVVLAYFNLNWLLLIWLIAGTWLLREK